MKLYKYRTVLTSQFDVSKLQKQLQSVIQIHLEQFVNVDPLPLNVCVTVIHIVEFNSINRKNDTKCNKSRQIHNGSIEATFCQEIL